MGVWFRAQDSLSLTEEVPDIMRQNPQFASIALLLTLCFGGSSAALAAPQSDSWPQRHELRERASRPAQESRQRIEAAGQNRQMERREQQNRQQAEQRESQRRQQATRQQQIRRQNDRQRIDMRTRQHEQQAVRGQQNREQAEQHERLRQQQIARERKQRQQALRQERERSRDMDDRRRLQQANIERQRQEQDARHQLQRQTQQQALLRQQHTRPQDRPQYRDGYDDDRRGHYAGNRENVRAAAYRRPYRPVYNDRPWYGYHGHGKYPHHRGPVVIYRNVTHVVMIPQPVYVQPVAGYYYDDYYYSGPYAGYDSVYGYDDYGYGYRQSACNSDTVGAVIGAVLGGVIGAHQDRGAGPVVGGALIGAVLGGLLGHAIDESNQACVSDILEYVPSNRSVYWEDGGYGYEVTPMRTYEPEPGRYCREYQTVVTVGGRAEQAYGTACRQPDGSWQIVS